MTTKFQPGDLTCIAPENVAALKSGYRSSARSAMSISESFFNEVMALKTRAGTVTHVFPPGHETSMRFIKEDGADKSFHMKGNFASRVAQAYGAGVFVAYPDYINRSSVESGGSLFGLFRVVDTRNDTETSLFPLQEASAIAIALLSGDLEAKYGTSDLRSIGTYIVELLPAHAKKTVHIVHSKVEEAEAKALAANPGYKLFNAKEEA